MALQNVYHHRRVAETSAKPCLICYKASSHVLTTPDSKDFFYICPGHLKDRTFAQPVGEKEDAEAKKKKEELEKEIEKVKKEYEEKMEKRKKKKGKDDKAKKKEEKDDKEQDAKDAKERDEKIKELEKGAEDSSKPEDGPRIFALHKTIYQSRVARYQNVQQAKRNQERLNNPNFFPNVPNGGL